MGRLLRMKSLEKWGSLRILYVSGTHRAPCGMLRRDNARNQHSATAVDRCCCFQSINSKGFPAKTIIRDRRIFFPGHPLDNRICIRQFEDFMEI